MQNQHVSHDNMCLCYVTELLKNEGSPSFTNFESTKKDSSRNSALYDIISQTQVSVDTKNKKGGRLLEGCKQRASS